VGRRRRPGGKAVSADTNPYGWLRDLSLQLGDSLGNYGIELGEQPPFLIRDILRVVLNVDLDSRLYLADRIGIKDRDLNVSMHLDGAVDVGHQQLLLELLDPLAQLARVVSLGLLDRRGHALA
jgi:hypothetical protein